MNNLFRKIGVGAIALSLVLGVAASNGLVANADSFKEGKKLEDFKVDESREKELDKLNDLDLIKLAEKKYGFKIFGFYLNSSSGKRRMKNEIQEVLDINSDKEIIAKRDKIENFLKDEANDFSFDYGKEFIDYLYQKGMDEGVKKIKIGDFIGIFIFDNPISPEKKYWIEDKEKDLKIKLEASQKGDHNLEDFQKEEHHLGGLSKVKDSLKKKLEL